MPRKRCHGAGFYTTEATPAEIANHLKRALDFVAANPSAARANMIVLSAWNEYLEGHWDVYTEGARTADLVPDRKDWRVVRDVLVADTDEEAMELALSTPIRRVWDEWTIPVNGTHLTDMLCLPGDVKAAS